MNKGHKKMDIFSGKGFWLKIHDNFNYIKWLNIKNILNQYKIFDELMNYKQTNKPRN